MYPDIYIRCCISELYSITFRFPNPSLDDITFHKKQLVIRQLFYSIFNKNPIEYIKQSRKLFYIQDNEIKPNTLIRLCYINYMKWGDKIIKGLQLSLLTSFHQDHHFDQLFTIPSDDTIWKTYIETKLQQFIKEINPKLNE